MMHWIHRYSFLFLLLFPLLLFAQKPKQPDAGEIKQALKKLNVFGSMLYLAAHPDDENTRLIGFYANGKTVQRLIFVMYQGRWWSKPRRT